jgi:hypothetical protein
MSASSSGEGLQQALREWQKVRKDLKKTRTGSSSSQTHIPNHPPTGKVELGKFQGDLDADAEEIERRRKVKKKTEKKNR